MARTAVKAKGPNNLKATAKPDPKLWDKIEEAQRKMKAAREEYLKWSVEPEIQGKYYLWQWVHAMVSSNYKYWMEKPGNNYIDVSQTGLVTWAGKLPNESDHDGPLYAFFKEYSDKKQKLLDAVEDPAGDLVMLLTDPSTVDLVKSFGVEGFLRWARVQEGLSQTANGRNWIKMQWEKPDPIWKTVEKKENHGPWFQSIGEKYDTDKAQKVVEGAFLPTLAEYASVNIKVLIEEQQGKLNIIKVLEDGTGLKLDYSKLQVTEKLKLPRTVTEGEIEVAFERLETRSEAWAKAGAKFDHFIWVAASFNLAAGLAKFVTDPSVKSGASATGAAATLLGPLVPYLKADWRKELAERLGNDAELEKMAAEAEKGEEIAKTAIASGKSGAFLGSSLAKLSKFTKAMGVVAGICDAVVGAFEISDDLKEGNYPKVAVDAVGIAGGLLSAAGFFTAMGGEGAAAPPFAAVSIVVGTILAVASIVVGWIIPHHANEIERFLDGCVFGKSPEGELKEQMERLRELLYSASLSDLSVTPEAFSFSIGLGGHQTTAKILLSVSLSIEGKTVFSMDEQEVTAKSKELKKAVTDKEDKNTLTGLQMSYPLDLPHVIHRVMGGDNVELNVRFRSDPDASGEIALQRPLKATMEWNDPREGMGEGAGA